MSKRVEIDIIVSSYLEEMRKDHDVKTIKEMVEKCIVFCYLNKVNFDNKNVKSINDLYILVDKLNRNVENLPLNIAKVLDSEA